MAHFAEIDESNVVLRVLVTDNNDPNGDEGYQWLIDNFGGHWVQTSYNHNFRNKYAGIGDIYNSVDDIFVINENNDDSLIKYQTSWQGIIQPINPSIMFDAVARSSNVWSMAVINQAFPQAFQRWGYLHPHNPITFSKALNNFDAIVTVIRNPIDSLASSIVAGQLFTDEAISDKIIKNKTMLTATKNNKNSLLIFKFEDIIANPTLMTNKIGEVLNVIPNSLNIDEINTRLEEFSDNPFYSLPKDNQDTLNTVKEQLQNVKFADAIGELNALCEEILT